MIDYHPVKVSGRPKRFHAALGLVLLLVVLFGLSQSSLRSFASATSLKILSPIWTIGRGIRNVFGDFGGIFTSKLKLENEVARLQTIIEQQKIAQLNQNILKQENLVLRELVNRAPDSLPLAIGRIVSQGRQFPLGQVIVDLGRKNEKLIESLAPGVIVASGGTVALGELTEIYETQAKLRLYSSAGFQLSGNLGEQRVPIELTGRGAGNFIASLPRDLVIAVGDQVTLTIAGQEFVLAVVDNIKRTAGDSFQQIFLRTPINLTQLTWVEMYAP